MHYFMLCLLSLSLFIVSPSLAEDKFGSAKEVKSNIAVFDLEVVGNLDKNVSRPLSESIRHEIMKSGTYEVLERSAMDTLWKEKSFQLAQCTQKSCAVEAGKLLGVEKIIVGSISMVGQTYYLSLSRVDVGTGKTELAEDDACKCEIDELIQLSKKVTNTLLGLQPGTPLQNVTQQSHQAAMSIEQKPSSLDASKTAMQPSIYQKQTEDSHKGFFVGLLISYDAISKSLFSGLPYSKSSSSGPTVDITEMDETNFGAGIRLGYTINKNISFEGTYHRTTFSVQGSSLYPTSFQKDLELITTSLDLKLMYYTKVIKPYLLLGIGHYNFSGEVPYVITNSAGGSVGGVTSLGKTMNEARFGAGCEFGPFSDISIILGMVKSSSVTMGDFGLIYHF